MAADPMATDATPMVGSATVSPTQHSALSTQHSPATQHSVKSCCANFYQNDYVRMVLGDSFHPGGSDLTKKLGKVLALGPEDHVLDVASGTGTSALVLADTFGCQVTGVDYGAQNVAEATAAANARCTFQEGDAECLPFGDGSFDAVVSECAFCTFPSKEAAAAEMFRVLKPGGRMGLTDVTIFRNKIPDGLQNLLSIVACIGDARPSAEYHRILTAAGFTGWHEEDESQSLIKMVDDIKKKIDLARFAIAIKKLDLGGMDLDAARAAALLAKKAIEESAAGYVLLTARKPAS